MSIIMNPEILENLTIYIVCSCGFKQQNYHLLIKLPFSDSDYTEFGLVCKATINLMMLWGQIHV